jgi:hypothetical protein
MQVLCAEVMTFGSLQLFTTLAARQVCGYLVFKLRGLQAAREQPGKHTMAQEFATVGPLH